ncbi:MAG: acryloyl-CoA reductase [Actinobacteria bacterium]|nr:acryloyl-CoA reductase [Actinomycetota bacterium]
MKARGLVARQSQSSLTAAVEDIEEIGSLGIGVEISWSALNYKDALALEPGNRVLRKSPLVLGVECAGTVVASDSSALPLGTSVLLQGHGLGTEADGGFATHVTVPESWVTPLPASMSQRDAMILGMAASTAMASIEALERHGLDPKSGQIVVTGAAGGVGSLSTLLASTLGYEVVASTGRVQERDYLLSLGAKEVLDRDAINDANGRVLGRERWAGAIDCVGASTLASLLRSMRYGSAVAASGLTGGAELETTVFPFITRGVSLLGIDVVKTPSPIRTRWWRRIAELKPSAEILESMVQDSISLSEIPSALAGFRSASVRGRILVEPQLD